MNPEDLRILIEDTKGLLDGIGEAAEEGGMPPAQIDAVYHEVEIFKQRLRAKIRNALVGGNSAD